MNKNDLLRNGIILPNEEIINTIRLDVILSNLSEKSICLSVHISEFDQYNLHTSIQNEYGHILEKIDILFPQNQSLRKYKIIRHKKHLSDHNINILKYVINRSIYLIERNLSNTEPICQPTIDNIQDIAYTALPGNQYYYSIDQNNDQFTVYFYLPNHSSYCSKINFPKYQDVVYQIGLLQRYQNINLFNQYYLNDFINKYST